MTVRWTRLSLAEWLLGVSALVLLIDLFAVTWFAYPPQFHATMAMLGQRGSANGWQSFEAIGPLTVVVCVSAVAIWMATAMRHSPAVPVVIATLLLPVSFVQAVLVAIRVLLSPPSVHLATAGGANVIETRAGAYIGLAASVALFVGVYRSLRRDAVAAEDSPAQIETVRVLS